MSIFYTQMANRYGHLTLLREIMPECITELKAICWI